MGLSSIRSLLKKIKNKKNNIILILILLASVLIYFSLVHFFYSYILDDAFISFRYAQNFVQGHGLVYNIGEKVEGYTNFLWVILLSFFMFLKAEPVLTAKILGIIFTLLSCFFVTKIFSSFNKKPLLWWGNLPIVTLFLTNLTLAVQSIEGLETPLFTFLLVLSFYLFLLEIEGQLTFPFSSLSLFVLALARPDGLIFFPLFLIFLLVYKRNFSKDFIFKFIYIFLALFGLYFVWRYLYYGYPFPNTYYAKGGGDIELIKRGWETLKLFFRESGGWVLLGLSVLPLFKKQKAIFYLIYLIILLRLGFHLWSGGAWMGHFRFLGPALPFIFLIVGQAFLIIYNLKKPKFLNFLIIVLCLIFLIHTNLAPLSKYRQSYQNYTKGLSRAHIALGKWIAKNTPEDTVIACDDAGALPYYSKRKNIDMLGLNDTHIAHLKGRFYEKYDNNYVLSKKPDLIILLGFSEKPEPKSFRVPSHNAMYENPSFQTNYRFLKSYRFADNYYLQVYAKKFLD